MLTAQALREIEELRERYDNGFVSDMHYALRAAKHIHTLLADRKALVEVLREIIGQTDCPDGRMAIDIVKERARRALQEDR